MKILIVYYSYEGTTAWASRVIAEKTGADTLAIKPVDEMKDRGFMKYVWGGRDAFMKKEPQLEKFSADPNAYDLIVIGTPVWAFTMTPPVRSFLTQTKVMNKKIALFCLHEGIPGNTIKHMQTLLDPSNTIVLAADIRRPGHQGTSNTEQKLRAIAQRINDIKTAQ